VVLKPYRYNTLFYNNIVFSIPSRLVELLKKNVINFDVHFYTIFLLAIDIFVIVVYNLEVVFDLFLCGPKFIQIQFKVSQKTWEFSDEFDIVFVRN